MSRVATHDEIFESERTRLLGVAYRITSNRAEADDIVQEAWLRWERADRSRIERPAAWLTTVTSRLALDRLRSAQHRRETYVGPWLPDAATIEPGPAERAELVESLTMGFLTVLERLQPIERAVFLLADVFDVPFDEIAEVVDRSAGTCRQIASRARRRVRDERPRFAPTDDEAWRVTSAFLDAAGAGDLDALMAVLAPDVVHVSDGGPHHRAARYPVVGADRVARLIVSLTQKGLAEGYVPEPRLINGQPGIVARDTTGVTLAMAVSVVEGRIERLSLVVNPDKLAALDHAPIR